MKGEEIARLVGGEFSGSPSQDISSFTFDSREVKEGDLFIPLKGLRDGHLFIEEALKRGARGSLTERELTPPPGRFVIRVRDSFEAFKSIARHRRSSFGGRVVAVTGSVGKSTTKELLFHLFSPFISAYRNRKSFNNEIGVTYTLANLPPDAELLIQEVGTSAPGEVASLKELVRPHISVVTAVELAHAEGFGSFEAVRDEKLSLTPGVEFAVVPHPFASLSKARETLTFGKEGDVRLTSLETSPEGSSFTVEAFGRRLELFTPVPGLSIVNASLVAVGVAHLLEIPLSELPHLIREFSPPSGRLRIERLGSTVLIDDSYNANPASFKNAIEVLSLFELERVAVVGQMLELGPYSRQEHFKLGRLLNSAGVSLLVAFGPETLPTVEAFRGKKFYFSDREELLDFFSSLPLDGKAILVKGSRGNRLERVCQIIRERLKS